MKSSLPRDQNPVTNPIRQVIAHAGPIWRKTCFFTSLTILVCLLNAVAAATFGLFTYTDTGTSITMTAYPTTEVGEIVIPSAIASKPVTSIGNNAFQGRIGLTNITIPASVTSNGASAFRGCSGLTNITIPASVTSIGGSTFYGCSALTNITSLPVSQASGAPRSVGVVG